MSMKRWYSYFCLILPFTALTLIAAAYPQSANLQDVPSPTPTYDPLAEPFVSENPSEYELGRNWYWHNCMTCHGDVGQGLTDEFRAIWPEDHQNCWEHGCHGGRRDDEGFPIPTVVPALVDKTKLEKFSSHQAFFDFLKSTHPPQDPGGLEDEQYRAIIFYIFNLNDRPLVEATPVPTFPPIPTKTPTSEVMIETETSPKANTVVYIGLGIVLTVSVIWMIKNRLPKS